MPDLYLISSAGGECQSTVGDLWRSMGWIMRGDVILLAAMLAYVIGITCKRFYRFTATRRHSRLFVRNVASALQRGNLNEVIVVATRHSRGHVPSIVAAGLTAFVDAAPQLSDTEVIGAAERAFHRRQRGVVADLKGGVGTLTSIGLLAPFIGLIGTVFGIMGAFVNGPDRATGISLVSGAFAEALVTSAFGLVVAIPAVWCRNYIVTRVEIFETEMSNATLETLTYCDSHYHLRHVSEHPGAEKPRHGSVLDDTAGTRSWEIHYDRPRGLLLLVSFYTLVFVLASVFTALVGLLGER
jgi:biopolymer transport protein ExbB/TolQ